jgi:hypothetical protein
VESEPTKRGELGVLRFVAKIISKVGFFSESRLLFCSGNLKKATSQKFNFDLRAELCVGGSSGGLYFYPLNLQCFLSL